VISGDSTNSNTTQPATVDQEIVSNSTEDECEKKKQAVVKKVVKKVIASDNEPETKVANTTVTKVVSDPKSKSGKKKKVVVKKIIKTAPKKKVVVIKPNVTKKANKTEEVDAIINDSDVVDKKNKIEYLENLEKDLEEATAIISKHKNELKV
jgi:hypothetical protein